MRLADGGLGWWPPCCGCGPFWQAQPNAQAVKVDSTPTCFRGLAELVKEYAKVRKDAKVAVDAGGSFVAVEDLGTFIA